MPALKTEKCKFCPRKFANKALVGLHTKWKHPKRWKPSRATLDARKAARNGTSAARNGASDKRSNDDIEAKEFRWHDLTGRTDRYFQAVRQLIQTHGAVIHENYSLRNRLERVTAAIAKAGLDLGGTVKPRPRK